MRRILGLVLAGGESRRFGSDKALAEADGRPLIDHAITTIAPFSQSVAISGRSYRDLVQVFDRPAAGLGPLGGLCGGLHHAAAHGYSHVLTIACDTPRVPADALVQLIAHPGPCVVAEHPVIGLWPATLAPHLELFLREGVGRAMRAWTASCGAGEIAVAGIVNINRPADLDAYLAEVRRVRG